MASAARPLTGGPAVAGASSTLFIWQGCDAILAAPLVLDLVRFLHHASGPATQA